MPDPIQPTNGELSPHIKDLLDAANTASQTVAALHVAFMAFAAYLGVIVWGTTDEALLLVSSVKLPILDVELPLTTFYEFAPWLLILLHFNLLIQLELLSRKLWNLDKDLPDSLAGQQVRDRLFIFPFTHMIAGRSSIRLIRCLLSMVVSSTVIALPLFMLLMAQIRFLPYHNEVITWCQRGAVWADIVMLFFLWPLIVSPTDDMWERWADLWFKLLEYLSHIYNWTIRGWNWLRRLFLRHWPGLNLTEIEARPMPQTGRVGIGLIAFLFTLLLAFLFSIVAVIPGNITVQTYYHPTEDSTKDQVHFEDWLIRHVYKSWLCVVDVEDAHVCTTLIPKPPYKPPDLKERVMLGGIFEWFDFGWFSRNLNLKEARLVPKEVSISLLTKAIDPDKSLRDAAFKEFEGLKLQGRDLRYANLSEALLLRADLRNVNLQGASLFGARLQGANLLNANLQGANLKSAILLDAYLFHTNLRGANLRKASLHNHTTLRFAYLQGANLSDAQLQGAKLYDVDLQGVNLSEANLQGAYLRMASLNNNTTLKTAYLKDADLTSTNLRGVDLRGAILIGTNLNSTALEGANLVAAHLQGADLNNATARRKPGKSAPARR